MSQIDELLKLTTPDRSGQRPMSIGPWQGIIATAPATFADRVSVIIPAFDPDLRWGPARWTSRDGLSKPQVGQDALVILDDQREPWVVAWGPGVAPTTPTPSSTFTGDVTARDGAASETAIGAFGPAGEPGILFGADTSWYRDAVDVLRTADAVRVDSDLRTRFGAASQVKVGSSGPSGEAGLSLGSAGDVNLYRYSVADFLKTDDGMLIAGDLYAKHNTSPETIVGSAGPAGEAGISLGSAHDTNLYRAAANVLRTDDSLIVAGSYIQQALISDTTRNALTAVEGMHIYNSTRSTPEVRSIDNNSVATWLPLMMGSNAGEIWRCEVVNVTIDLPSRAGHVGGTSTVTINFMDVGDIVFLLAGNTDGSANGRIMSVRTPVITTANQLTLTDFNADSTTVDPNSMSMYFFIIHRS